MITLRMDDDSAREIAVILAAFAEVATNQIQALTAKGTAESIRMALNHAPINKGITASYSSE